MTADSRLSLSVLIPTYRRVDDLRRCLGALAAQSRQADEIVVVVRDSDAETLHFLAPSSTQPSIQICHVAESGQIAALNVGLDTVRGDIVAITDDDAAPRPEWLARIEQHFLQDESLGGVGGRDHVAGEAREAGQHVVGKRFWYGRTVGNHHLGIGGPRYVDFLKGANMSYRRVALGKLRFDTRLRGSGAQVHNEFSVAFALSRQGWRLLYDPAVAVDHYPSVRYGDDPRGRLVKQAVENRCYNAAISLTQYLPWHGRVVYLAYSVIVGNRDHPGLMQCVRLMVCEHRTIWPVLVPALRGHMHGWWAAVRG